MKSKLFITASVVAVMAVSAVGFAACGEQGGVTDTVTVTYYDGTNELKSEEVEKGGKATDWTPEKEGYEFMGWYAEASLSETFSFDTVIYEDTDIFSAWRENAYVEDTAAWYLIGAGSGDMSASNWSHSTEGLFLTKDETITDKNVYTIELTMYASDKFQITHSDSWDYQQGIGHMIGFEYAAGINPYAPDAGEVTAADKKYGEVKDASGNVVFYGGDEYDKGAEVWNIWLAEGQDGKYKFTYTTYPSNPAYNTIEWELVEKLDPLATTHDMAFIGTMNNWDATALDDWKLTQSDDKSYWSGVITITADMCAAWTQTDGANPYDYILNENNEKVQATDDNGDPLVDENGNPVYLKEACAALKIYNIINGGYYSDSSNNIFLKEGSYAFKYTVEGDKVEYQELAWYVVGTFLDEDGNAVNYAVKEGVTPEMTVVDGVASCTVTLADVSANSNYSWIAAQNKTDKDGNAAQAAIKVVFGSEIAISGWYGDGDDNYYLAAGTYNISIDIATGAITIEAVVA